ncbi:hypothetical protein [Myxococcus sp. Y35]|uniref:hypothetical protein n=1 Tax=Pseudomyxococcus flavus TaxID=3115648 RepID=UPI003CECF80F
MSLVGLSFQRVAIQASSQVGTVAFEDEPLVEEIAVEPGGHHPFFGGPGLREQRGGGEAEQEE